MDRGAWQATTHGVAESDKTEKLHSLHTYAETNIYIYRQHIHRSPGLGRSLGEVKGYPTAVFWPGAFHGLYSPWGCKELDKTEPLSSLGNIYTL